MVAIMSNTYVLVVGEGVEIKRQNMKDQGKCIFKMICSASFFPITVTLYETCKMIDTDGKRIYKG